MTGDSLSVCDPLLPVLDLRGGRVVRAVAGDRAKYRPVESCLTAGSTPGEIGAALVERFGFRRAYVADLDALTGGAADEKGIAALRAAGLELWLDAGPVCREVDPGITPLAALEWLETPAALAQFWCTRLGAAGVFSLDLRHGKTLAASSAWPENPLAAAELAVEAGAERMIVLDLAAVGTGDGSATAALCRELVNRFPKLHITSGGGVRDCSDVLRLLEAGCSEVLVASALHSGKITPAEVEQLRARHTEG